MVYNEELMKQATRLFIKAVGGDVEYDSNLIDTPKRVAKMYNILLGGVDLDPATYLTTFPSKSTDLVILANIPVFSFCAHHLLPYIGKLSIGYIPKGKVVGLSKLVRFSRCCLKGLTIQEDLTHNIAETLFTCVKPKGCMVYMAAHHLCVTIRGVRSHGATMITSAVRGNFDKQAEFMQAITREQDSVWSY